MITPPKLFFKKKTTRDDSTTLNSFVKSTFNGDVGHNKQLHSWTKGFVCTIDQRICTIVVSQSPSEVVAFI